MPMVIATRVVDALLPGKASKLQVIMNRTVNRHRWVGWEF